MDNLTIIRHAETDWARQGKHTGLTDISINSNGQIQAQHLAKQLNPNLYSHILVSPLKRAIETATLAGLMGKAQIEPDLVEWNYGRYEGLTSDQINQIDPNWNIFTSGGPDGESVDDACHRANRLLQKLDKLPGDVLIVSSGHISRLIACCWLGLEPTLGNHLALYPASRSLLGMDKKKRAILLWNS